MNIVLNVYDVITAAPAAVVLVVSFTLRRREIRKKNFFFQKTLRLKREKSLIFSGQRLILCIRASVTNSW